MSLGELDSPTRPKAPWIKLDRLLVPFKHQRVDVETITFVWVEDEEAHPTDLVLSDEFSRVLQITSRGEERRLGPIFQGDPESCQLLALAVARE